MEQRRFIAIVCLLAALVVMWPYASQVLREDQEFTRIFGVSAPWLMSGEARTALQPIVTGRLLELNAELAVFRGMPCGSNDKECAITKNLYIVTSQRDLNKALRAAEIRHFNLTLPLCGDGFPPVDGKCIDGSRPRQ
jgi:hypothetical protein